MFDNPCEEHKDFQGIICPVCIYNENKRLRTDKEAMVKEVENLKTMSTVEMMCENKSVEQHITEWEKRCLKAEEELSDLHARYAALCAFCGTSRRELTEKLEKEEKTRAAYGLRINELESEVENLRCCGSETHHHVFDGKVWYSADGRTGSVTCSICGMPEIFWDEKNLT